MAADKPWPLLQNSLIITHFRFNAKRAPMVQSRIKALERLPVLVPVEKEAEVSLKFPDIETLSGSVIQLAEVTFAYPGNPACFSNVDLSANASSRICIVRITYTQYGYIRNDVFVFRTQSVNLESK